MKVSRRKKGILANQAKIKRDLIEEYGLYCMLGNHYVGGVQLVHIIRQSYSIPLQDDKRNCVLGCQHCHEIFDDGGIEEVLRLKGIDMILARMKELDELYYNRFRWRTLPTSPESNG